ncbi:MAG: hybrid sensor histidine kinase/response regulator [Myxococcaceae bacterium]
MADPLIQELVQGFVAEVEELTGKATRALLRLERGEGAALAGPYEELARGLHTLKGSSATLGLVELAGLAHHMEDAIAPFRNDLRPTPPALADALLRSLDGFLTATRAQAAGAPAPISELAALTAALAQPQPEPVPATDPDPAPPPGDETWRVNASQITSLTQEIERLREARLRLDERRRELDRATALLSRLSRPAETAEIRALLASSTRGLLSEADESAAVVDRLEDALKTICTLPLRTLLEPLHRTVRDLCRQTGKEARLSVVGAEVSLDRRVLDALKAPLLHLVRNALDHGIEAPATRQSRGKHREGALVIRIELLGNLLFLELSDDGNGLDTARIRDEAIARGLAPPAELLAMAPAQLHQFVFRPGFTTHKEVTGLSGRGVGLDVVRSQAQTLHGQVEVQSVPGQGTRFVLSLPAELGSTPVMAVRCGEHVLGLPMAAIEALRRCREDLVRVGRGRMHLQDGEELLPLIDLAAALGLRQAAAPAEGQPVALVQARGHRVAVAVDEVVGDREVVIRPLPRGLREVPAYQGAATLGSGELLLVLRPDWLVDTQRRSEAPVAAARRALVVDDSLTARALHRSVLESGGFSVHTAASARQALEQLQHGAYDVIICDVGMEEMDGLAFTQEVRGLAATRALPVVLVSAHDTDSDRAAGLAAGADAFLSKKDCRSGRLLAEVTGVMAKRLGAG